MNCSLKLTLQPSDRCTKELIRQLIDDLYKKKTDIKVEFHDQITEFNGDYIQIMRILTEEFEDAFKKRGINDFTFKISLKFIDK